MNGPHKNVEVFYTYNDDLPVFQVEIRRRRDPKGEWDNALVDKSIKSR